MPNIRIDGIDFEAEEGWTILEVAKFLGIEIPTFCHHDGLSEWGGCRLCVVEIGEGENAKLVTSCTYPVEEGLIVRTDTERVIRTRKMVIELLLASSPMSKTIQDLASKYDVHQQRFKQEFEECIMCGLCTRMCEEQMMAKAIGFRGRGQNRSIGTPFDITSEECRRCGACMYICPICMARCQGPQEESPLCNACLNLSPPCVETYGQKMCYMDPCVACELAGPYRKDKQRKEKEESAPVAR